MKVIKLYILTVLLLLNFSIFSQDIKINEIMASNDETIEDIDGDYSDWIELYNNSGSPINLESYYLTDDEDEIDQWEFPSVSIPAHGFLIIYASGKDKEESGELHTNFKLKSSGEYIILSDPSENTIDSLPPINLETDKTYGRINDGSTNLGYITSPTPNTSNNNAFFQKELSFSKEAGFYENDFQLKITGEDSIYYTLNGAEPTTNSFLYKDSLLISKDPTNQLSLTPTTFLSYIKGDWPNNEFGFTTPKNNIKKAVILRARSFKNGKASSDIYTKTFFTNEHNYTFPVFSIITDSLSLFDHDTGIYVPGIHWDENNTEWTGNYHERGSDWERLGNVELYDTTGKLEFSEGIGIRISGNKSRAHPQKSLRLYFRSEYGLSWLNYSFFPSRDYNEVKRLTLRSSYTYWYGRNTLFQDDLLHTIAANNELNIDFQMSQPSIVYINGEYWGIHNIRERLDKYYLESIYGVDPDEVDILSGNGGVTEGSADDYLELIDFIKNNDIADSTNYNYVKTKMDIDNFIDYIIFELYYSNEDWPDNNAKLWKSHEEGSKWRWLMYDLDATMVSPSVILIEQIENQDNNLAVLINNLFLNNEFKTNFSNRFIELLQSAFLPESTIETLNQFREKYAPEVTEHQERWTNSFETNSWETSCDLIEKFFIERPCYIKSFLIEKFQLEELKQWECSNTLKNSVVTIFPNPTIGNVTLYTPLEDDSPKSVIIYNELGQELYKQSITEKYTSLSIDNFRTGLYYFRFQYNDNQITKKVVVSK